MLTAGPIRTCLALCGVVVFAPVGRAQPGVATPPKDADSTSSAARIVHRFDFDEWTEGNLEDIPKYWEPLRPSGFPHYTLGAFDFQIGRTAPPSFHLASEGRNVAYHYLGPQTRVRVNVDYRIEGFVRADRLRSARACLSAHFLDRFAEPVPHSLVRSRYIGGTGDGDAWVRVELHLPAAPVGSHSIGLVGWVLQEDTWRDVVPRGRHIPRTDVRGGAWFDDLTIYALPHARITTNAPGNVLVPGERQELHVVLTDIQDPNVYANLSIVDADGKVLDNHRIPVAQHTQYKPIRIPVDHLPPGLYRGILDVIAGDTLVVSRTLTFARLAPRLRTGRGIARPFGVVVDEQNRTDPATELALLTRQTVRSVKLPIWTSTHDEPTTPAALRETDRLLHELTKVGFALTAVLADPPRALAGDDRTYALSLIELFSGDPGVWMEHLAAVVAPYSSMYRWWQIGRDGSSPVVSGGDIVLAAKQVRETMRSYTTMPRLAVPASTDLEVTAQKLPVEQISLAIGQQVRPVQFAALIEPFRSLGYQHVSVYVEPLPGDRYRRLPRLADWAQRVITARHAGADTVFVPQTWRTRRTPTGPVTEPSEVFVMLRTIADVLADAVPGPQVPLSGDIRCLAFQTGQGEHDRTGGVSVLAIWDPTAPPEGRPHAVQLGQAKRQIDLWGKVAPFRRDVHGRQVVHLSSMPVFVVGVERWLIDFRTSLSLKPAQIELGTELARHDIDIAYQGERALSGDMILQAPSTLEISPRMLSFNALPRRLERHTVEVRYPHNEPAGSKQILAKMTLSPTAYYLEIPLAVELSLTDLAVWGLAIPEGDDLVLRHIVTNRSASILSFRGTANVPGRQRQYRPIANLRPGDTQTLEYRFLGAGALAGRSARLVLRELNDGPRIHCLELNIP